MSRSGRTYYEYSLTAMGFKEDILVLAYTGQTEYSFTLQTGGLTAVNQSGTWVLVDEDNTVRASLSDVIVFTADERNNTFGELQVEEITAGQTYRLTGEPSPASAPTTNPFSPPKQRGRVCFAKNRFPKRKTVDFFALLCYDNLV